ncbi:MAG: c-type cytochrome, partial [Hyphomicrobiales bacterium]|nr:c-type cytochrome [Hyphomicrobiales bacterium]
LYRHGWGINGLKALPDAGKLLFGALNGEAGVIDVESGKVSTVLAPHEGPVLALAVRPDIGLAATGGADGVVNVWATGRWARKQRHANPYGPIWGLAFARDGKRLYYSGLDDFVTAWQMSPRKPFEEVASPYPRRFQATKDMSLGERQFARKCSVCHTLKPDDGNRAGPTLYKVFGRRAGSLPGYPYSDALKKSDIIWTEKTIGLLFDHGPQQVTPGSKMPLQQILDPRKRKALIAYLKTATSGEGEPQGRPEGESPRSTEQSK